MSITKMLNDIHIDQYDYGVDIKFNLTTKQNTPFNLNGYEVQLIIKAKKDDLDEKAIYNKIFVCKEGNTIRIPVEKELTSNPVGNYFYAIRLIKDGIYVNTIIQARLYIKNNTFEEGI